MTDLSVAIVGLGSRGLGVLERIVSFASRAEPSPVRVELIDPTCAGSGVHATDQPDYLLLNTTCAQVSLFPDPASVGGQVGRPGPSLHEWVLARGLRLADDGYTVGSGAGPGTREIRPTDFLPRRLLGEYLEWFLAEMLRRAPAHVQVTTHRAAAVDLLPGADGQLVVALSDGTQTAVGDVFLTTGYTPNSRGPVVAEGVIAEPYPLPAQVDSAVGPGQVVAIGGFGLSAMDMMSCLTVGRGGLFVHARGACSYLPSGREPTLLFFSRSGVPSRARPLVTEFGAPYRPLVFTPGRLDALRRVAGGPLDFDADILPLVLTEMRVAFRRCQARLAGPVALSALERALAATGDGTEVLDGLDARLGPFDAAEAFDGAAGMALADSAAYQNWLAEVVRLDLAEGVLGFAGSPLKAALDVLRELRDTFRHAVDFGGLTGRSLDDFTARTIPFLNRAVVGPQFERHAELLALVAAGIAEAPFGPAPSVTRCSGTWQITSSRLRQPFSRDVDWLVAAHVELPSVQASASPLIAALHRKGWLRPCRPDSRYVHGVDVDPNQHPLAADGRPRRQVWVLGPLCEGATFYNNLVPSPGGYSRPVFDAHRCVTAMFATAAANMKETAWMTSSS